MKNDPGSTPDDSNRNRSAKPEDPKEQPKKKQHGKPRKGGGIGGNDEATSNRKLAEKDATELSTICQALVNELRNSPAVRFAGGAALNAFRIKRVLDYGLGGNLQPHAQELIACLKAVQKEMRTLPGSSSEERISILANNVEQVLTETRDT
jgi:hypothetical protein